MRGNKNWINAGTVSGWISVSPHHSKLFVITTVSTGEKWNPGHASVVNVAGICARLREVVWEISRDHTEFANRPL